MKKVKIIDGMKKERKCLLMLVRSTLRTNRYLHLDCFYYRNVFADCFHNDFRLMLLRSTIRMNAYLDYYAVKTEINSKTVKQNDRKKKVSVSVACELFLLINYGEGQFNTADTTPSTDHRDNAGPRQLSTRIQYFL